MYWTSILVLVFVPLASSVGLYQQCGGEGYVGSTECDQPLKCFERSRWFSSCQISCPGVDWKCVSSGDDSKTDVEDDTVAPNCPTGWICSEIIDEEIDEEDLEELEEYDPELEEEEEETDDFPDPSVVDLDALQQREQALLGEVDEEEDPFAGAEDEEEESTSRRRRRNTG
jgi:hypothetical protein